MPYESQAKVILLKKVKYRESDLILQCLSSQGQKISLIARGAINSRKRFNGGILEPMHYLDIRYSNYKNSAPSHLSTLYHLKEAKLIHSFEDIKKKYESIQLACFILDTVNKVALEGDRPSQSLFDIIGNALLMTSSIKKVSLFKLHFLVKLLWQQGILKQEGWMKPFLSYSLKEHHKIQAIESIDFNESVGFLNDLDLLEIIQNELSYYLGTTT